jgi:hypothetical protein
MTDGAAGPRLRSGLVSRQAVEAPAVCITRSSPPDQVERRLAGGSYRSPIIQGRVAIARWSPRVSMPAFGGTHQIVR